MDCIRTNLQVGVFKYRTSKYLIRFTAAGWKKKIVAKDVQLFK